MHHFSRTHVPADGQRNTRAGRALLGGGAPLVALLLLAGLFWLLRATPSLAGESRLRAPAAQAAAVLYASASGTGSDCTAASPCPLQTAVDVSSDGDTIFVAGGRYAANGAAEVLQIPKTVTLEGGYNDDFSSRDAGLYLTTLDGGETTRVVYIAGGNPTLDGFYILNGRADLGAGAYITAGSRPSFNNTRFQFNQATTGMRRGGALYDAGGSTVTDSQLWENSANRGGAVYVAPSAVAPSLRFNELYGNSAEDQGGAIFLEANAANLEPFLLEGNIIGHNNAILGGGLFAESNTLVLATSNLIAMNDASSYGGGLWSNGEVSLWNNTVADNSASTAGGGLYIGGTAAASNNIIAGNTAPNHAGIDVDGTISGGFNNVYDNDLDPAASSALTSTLDSPPGFANPIDSYHLHSESDNIDAGDSNLPAFVGLDWDRQPRPFGAGVDVGADEYHPGIPNFTLSPDSINQYGERGTQVTLQHTLVNDGTAADTYTFTCELDRAGWSIDDCPAPISLDPATTAPVETLVSIPDSAPALETARIIVEATSDEDPTLSRRAFVYLSVTPHPGLSFTPDYNVAVEAGRALTLTHVLTNSGDAPDSFHVWLDAPASSWGQLLPSASFTTTALLPGSSTSIRLVVQVPQYAPAGLHDVVTIHAASSFDDTVAASVVDTITARATTGTRYVSPTGTDADNNCTVPNTAGGAPGPCRTVDHAVGQAAVADEVRVAQGTYPESGINVNNSLRLSGGWNSIFTNQGAPGTTVIDGDGAGDGRIVDIAPGSAVAPAISNLTFANGYAAAPGGAILVGAGARLRLENVIFDGNGTGSNGGALYAAANSVVTAVETTFRDNEATVSGGALYLNGATLTLHASRVISNTAGSNGGALAGGGTIVAYNNLFAGNSAAAHGGAWHTTAGTATSGNNTVTGNEAGGNGGGFYNDGATLAVDNTLFAGNSASDGGAVFGEDGRSHVEFVLLWENAELPIAGGVSQNDVRTGDPRFADGDYRLQRGSAAIDTGGPTALTVDFEGDFRPSDQGYDIGWDEMAGCRAKRDGAVYGSIQDALDAGGSPLILVHGLCRGVHPLSVGGQTISQTVHIVNQSVHIQGGWNGDFSRRTFEPTIVDPEGRGRAFYVSGSGASPILESLTIQNGNAGGLGGAVAGASAGGAIYNLNSSLVLTRSTILSSTAAHGGAIYNQSGSMVVNAARLFENEATGSGGAVYNATGALSLLNTVLAGNRAADGAGFYTAGGAPAVWHNTFYDNAASARGGGLFSAGGSPVVRNNIFQDNAAPQGSAFYVAGGAPSRDYNYYYPYSAGVTTNFFPAPHSIAGNTAPGLADPAAGDFHLEEGAAAVDAGDPASPVTRDFEGDRRPSNQGFDMGADELAGCYAMVGGVIYGSIQEALKAAPDGATVRVAGRCTGVHSVNTASYGGDASVCGGQIGATVHITRPVTLQGGWNNTFTSQNANTVLDALGRGRVIYVAPGSNPTIETFEIRGGAATGAAGAANGGGLCVDNAAATIQDNRIHDNSAAGSGGAIFAGRASAIVAGSNQITDNAAATGGGVGLSVTTPATVQNNFFVGNSATHGGAFASSAGANRFWHNTVVDNSATGNGGGLYVAGGAPDVRNNVVTGNSGGSGGGIFGGTGSTPSVSFNDFFDNTPSDFGGTIGDGGAGNLSVDPQFVSRGGLAYLLDYTSPVVDQGDPTVPVLADFEGDIRPSHQGMDMGADEVGGCYARIVGDPAGAIYGSLQRAVDEAPGGGAVQFSGKCQGVNSHSVNSTMTLQGLFLDKSLTVDGNWNYANAGPGEIWPLGHGRGVFITGGADVTLTGVTIAGGDAGSAGYDSGNGGGVYNAGTLHLTGGSHVLESSATNGGGLYNAGTAIVEQSELNDNAAGSGGALYQAAGTLWLDGNRLYGNSATSGGALYVAGAGDLRVWNNFIYRNTAARGGGITYAASGAGRQILHNTLVANSAGANQGGAIYVAGGSLAITNNIVDGNSGNGIYVAAASVTVDYNNVVDNLPANYAGPMTIGGHNITQPPTYVNPAEDDYHLQPTSAGIDLGTTAGVDHDIDGDLRPTNRAPDIGADELALCLIRAGDRLFGVLQDAIDYAERNAISRLEVARGECRGVLQRNGSWQVGYVSGNLEIAGSLERGTFADRDDYNSAEVGANSTVFNAEGNGRALYVAEGATLSLRHVVLVSGNAVAAGDGSGSGGAIYNAGEAAFDEINICQSSAANGGGYYAPGGTINRFEGGYSGDCIAADLHSSPPAVLYRFYSGNTATDGGGYYFESGATVDVRSHGWFGNAASGDGGGLYSAASPRIVNGIFFGNSAGGNGGGLYNSGTLGLYHNTFNDNEAGDDGGAIYSDGSLTLNSSIVYDNRAIGGSHGGAVATSPVQDFNLFFANSGSPASFPLAPGTIQDDPLLVGPYRLHVDSPAIDQADPDNWQTGVPPGALKIDFDADTRLRPDGNSYGPYPDLAPSDYNSDIGAFEWPKEFGCTVDFTPPSRTVQPGEIVTYSVSITNTGRLVAGSWRYYTDTLTITLDNSTLGWAELEGDPGEPVTLGGRQSVQRVLTVTVPADATTAQMEVSTVRCTSASFPTATSTGSAVTRVGLDGGVLVEPDYEEAALPGDVLTFTHRVTNVGNQTDTFALTASSGPRHATAALVDEFGAIYTPTVTLAPGETYTVVLRARILDTATAGDTATPGVVARSTADPLLQGASLNTISIGDTSGTRYVAGLGANDNSNCTDPQNPCATIAHAIDQAVDGDTILVAAGAYAPVLVDKSVAIRGGYSTADSFTSAQPITRAVTLAGSGQPIVEVAAGATVTLSGLFVRDGDEVGILSQGALTISGTWLLDNAGSALVHDGPSLTVVNSVFAGNGAEADEGGAIRAAAGELALFNNSFAANSAGSSGGALYQAAGALALYNNIFSGNSDEQVGAIHLESEVEAAHDYNLYDETAAGLPDEPNGQSGDPLFAGDYYHLGAGSPAIDSAGAEWAPSVDFELESRPQGIGYDIGADEYTQRAGFDFLPAAQTAFVVPGGSITFYHTITNTGDFADTYSLAVTNSPLPASSGWNVTVLPTGPIALAPGASQQVEVAVTAPVEPGYRNTTIITATGAASAAAVEDTAIVSFEAGVAIAPSREGSGLPGDIITYTHTITNAGSGYDSFTIDLAASPPTGWLAAISPESVALDAGAHTGFTVTVQIPAAAAYGAVYEALVAAVSGADPTVRDELVDTTTVAALPGYSVAIAPLSAESTGAPGDAITYTHTVTNSGSAADSYELSVTGNSWPSAVSPETLDLEPGETAQIEVAVTIPVAAEAGETDSVTVNVGSPGSGASASATDTTTAGTPPHYALSLLPASLARTVAPGGTAIYTHTLTNEGNTADTIHLVAPTVPGWPTTVTPPQVSLAAGESTAVRVEVEVPSGAAAGSSATTTVTATSAGDATVSATAVDVTTAGAPAGDQYGVALSPGTDREGFAGQTVTFQHTVTNTGTVADSIAVSGVSDQGWSIQAPPDPLALDPGESALVSIAVTIQRGAPVGQRSDVTVTAQSLGDPAVSAEAVNSLTVIAQPPPAESRLYLPLISNRTAAAPPPPPVPTATAEPTPVPGPSATPLPSPTPCTPTGVDLIVTNITVQPLVPRAGEEAIVFVTIKNQGSNSVRTGNNFYLDFYIDRLPAYLLQGDLYWGVQASWMAAGASRTFSAPYVFTPGSHNLYAMVDTDNSVDECPYEGNNSYGPVGINVLATALSPGGDPAGGVPTAAPTMDVPRRTPTPQPRDDEP